MQEPMETARVEVVVKPEGHGVHGCLWLPEL
jgi:hypothetical protein